MAHFVKPPCDEGVILSGPSTVPCPQSAKPWILVATILGSSLAFIDGTIVNLVLPALQKDLNATVLDVQWVVESYALFLAALLLVGGSLGDRIGRRLVYAVGIAIFALASAWCGFASDIDSLILARASQGIGAALLVPGSLAILSTTFSEEERGRAIGTWSGFTAITAALGPVLGGWLIEHVSWRAAFFINLPLAIIALILVFRFVPESRDPRRTRLDWWGAMLAAVGLGGVVYALIESSNLGIRHPAVIVPMIAGTVSLALFVMIEKRLSNPMLPLALFRSKNFTGANLLTFFLYAALNGALLFFPLNLIQVQGYTATSAGAALLPFTLSLFFLSRWSGGLIKRYGSRTPLIVGPSIVAVGFLLFTIPTISSNYWTSFFPAVVVLGFGMAISVAPLTTTVMNSVKESQSGIASGISNAVSRTAGLLAVAVFGVMILQVFNNQLDLRLRDFEINEDSRAFLKQQRNSLAGMDLPRNLEPRTKTALRQAIQISFISAFRWILVLAAGLALFSAAIAWLRIEKESHSGGAERK